VGLAFASDALWRRLELVATYQQDDAITGRLQAWRVGWAIFLDRWGWGVGIGNFALAWPLYADSPGGKWITAHNAFIQILGELGAVGLVVFVALLGTTVLGLRRARRAASRVAAGEIASFAAGLEVALWGYVSCGMLLSVAFNWFLYLLMGLSVAVLAMAPPAGEQAAPVTSRGRTRPWG
jgi:O-antigen ligase